MNIPAIKSPWKRRAVLVVMLPVALVVDPAVAAFTALKKLLDDVPICWRGV